jgi:hypothetical protein
MRGNCNGGTETNLHQRRYMPCDFRIEPTNPVASNCKIRWLKHSRMCEFQDFSIGLRPYRLHQIEHQRGTVFLMGMEIADRGIVSLGSNFRSDVTFKDGIQIIQESIYGMRCVAVNRLLSVCGGARTHMMPKGREVVAQALGTDASNLSKCLAGKRRLSARMLTNLSDGGRSKNSTSNF